MSLIDQRKEQYFVDRRIILITEKTYYFNDLQS